MTEDKLRESSYDGIQEYDNDLPRWWLWLFYITIAYAVAYPIYRHFGFTNTEQEQLAIDLKALEEQRGGNSNGTGSEDSLLVLVNDAGRITSGKKVFTERCVACHGANGEGGIGPNMTDKYWIHGGKISDLKRVIEQGVLDKGMLAWKGVIPDDDITSVVVYVWSLRGTTPPNPKEPQGDLVE